MYDEEEFLALSGIQHFAFCRRQWALIHIDQQWAENILTVQGEIMHQRAHDTSIREKRGDTLIIRGLAVHSSRLGISGVCDIVEFHRDHQGHPLCGEDGLWLPMPVEYKRGRTKKGDEDRLQLCAQALCLEEMLSCTIETGCLYYGESTSREHVRFSEGLRSKVYKMTEEMHALYQRGYIPNVRRKGSCRACSLHDFCLPKVIKKPVQSYIDSYIQR